MEGDKKEGVLRRITNFIQVLGIESISFFLFFFYPPSVQMWGGKWMLRLAVLYEIILSRFKSSKKNEWTGLHANAEDSKTVLFYIDLEDSRRYLKTKPNQFVYYFEQCWQQERKGKERAQKPLTNMDLQPKRRVNFDYEINLVREISWHRGKNCLYRAFYGLFKELQEIAEQAMDALRFLYQHKPRLPHESTRYRPVADIAAKLQWKLENLTYREREALDSWNELQSR